MNDNMPVQVIIPHNSDEPQQPGDGAPQPVRPLEDPGVNPGPVPTSAPAPEAALPMVVASAEPSQIAKPTPVAEWRFNPSTDARRPDAQTSSPESMSWTASEFIAHEKGLLWYATLVAVGLAAAALDYVLTGDKLSTGVIVFAIIVFSSFAARKPRTQDYAITHQGLQIGVKDYYFKDFKNFSVVEEGAIASIIFMPLKRFMPPLTIYVAPDMEQQVMSFLSEVLPLEQHRADAVDGLLRRIRF